ncbi:replicative DNA helicase [Paenibacillus thailandensis]|uniref:Replicative DNA helicase n=1 Tax=Paenibacillus thailandensis TaxID=393250 RepID=A0ABW5R3E1_9BACL
MSVLLEAERAVLGAILREPDLMDECYLQPEEFGDDQHALIMEYLRFTYDQDGTIDILLMAQRSGKNLTKIGGITYLMQLRDAVPSESHFTYYQTLIRNAYVQRRAAETMRIMAEAGSAEDVNAKEYVAEAQAALEEIAELTAAQADGGVRRVADVLAGHADKIAERKKKRGLTGGRTASRDLDKITGGHQDGDFEVIAARPSMGKSAYIVNDMVRTARGGRAAAIFSLEMTAEQLAERFVCVLGNLDHTKLRTGDLENSDWERWSYALDELDQLPIMIDDTPGMTLQDIRRKAKQLKKKHPSIVIYIDFLQLVQPGRRFAKEHEGVAYVSKGLKLLARMLQCPVVAISAVGRSVEQRQDKRPMMSDLRESGSIESDADIVIFLYRDDYYNKESEKKGRVELILAKGRNVGTGTVEMLFDRRTGKFLDLDYSHHQAQGGDSSGKATGQNRK